MSRRIISTTAAPAAIGTYSQAVAVGGTVYVSGQIPLDPATGQMVEGDFAERTRQVFRNLARATVQVSALPRGTDVEIDAVLVLD